MTLIFLSSLPKLNFRTKIASSWVVMALKYPSLSRCNVSPSATTTLLIVWLVGRCATRAFFFWWFIWCEAVHHCRWDNNTVLSDDDIQHRTKIELTALVEVSRRSSSAFFFDSERIFIPKLINFSLKTQLLNPIEWNRACQWVNFTERKSRIKSSAEYAQMLPLTLESLSPSLDCCKTSNSERC